MSATNREEKRLLETSVRRVEIGLFRASPTEAGRTEEELTGGEYRRQRPTWNAVTEGEPSEVNNSGVITFPRATANLGRARYIGLIANAEETDAGTMRHYEVIRNSRGETVEIEVNIDTTVSFEERQIVVTAD